MRRPKIIYIGGTPMTGKTTIARILSCRLQYECISTDDIGAAITAVTDGELYPRFHYMSGHDHRDYYTRTGMNTQIRDINAYHAALWPALRVLINNHATWGNPLVIEGWALRPAYMAGLRGDVAGLFLLADDALIEQRALDSPFTDGAADRALMVRRYVERSRRYTSEIRSEITRLGLSAITVTHMLKPKDIAEECMRVLGCEG